MTWFGARAHTNIALVKYWGKRDEQLILPLNSSLSLTLDAFYTETYVQFSDKYTQDTFYLDQRLQSEQQSEKVFQFLELVRALNSDTRFAAVHSENYVPTAAGLASSASGMAALASACNQALDLKLDNAGLSRLARRGSGSACRSIHGGFAEWQKGDSDGTSYAVPISAQGWEEELAMVFVLLFQDQKAISSRDGMKRTVETSVFYPGWLEAAAADLTAMKDAIRVQDFEQLGQITESNSLKMHGTTLGATPPFTYWLPESLAVMDAVRAIRTKGIACYSTMDAGPNVKILVQKRDLHPLIAELRTRFPEHVLIPAFAGPGVKSLESRNEDD